VSFARDPGTLAYYHRRAEEYDEWYEGEGKFAARERPGWEDELGAVVDRVAALPPARTLDVACGTAFLSRHLKGLVVGLDASPAMVAIAQERLPGGLALVGDALDLPFADGAFDRVLTGHFYGHLTGEERTRFLAEARRVAPELVVVDSALRPGVPARPGRSAGSTTAPCIACTSATSRRRTCGTSSGPRSSNPARGS